MKIDSRGCVFLWYIGVQSHSGHPDENLQDEEEKFEYVDVRVILEQFGRTGAFLWVTGRVTIFSTGVCFVAKELSLHRLRRISTCIYQQHENGNESTAVVLAPSMSPQGAVPRKGESPWSASNRKRAQRQNLINVTVFG